MSFTSSILPVASNGVCLTAPSIIVGSPIVYALGSDSVVRPLPISAQSSCSTPQCTVTVADAHILVNGISITLYPDQALGNYAANVSCTASGRTQTTSFTISVVNPTSLQRTTQSTIPIIPDCVNTTVTTAALSATADGGVADSMIRLGGFPSENGDVIWPSQTIQGVPYGYFTLQSIKDGLVKVQPKLLDRIGLRKSISIPIEISDPAGHLINDDVKYEVVQSYCPLGSSLAQLRTTGVPVVITSQHLALKEAHGLSVWDVEWILPTPSFGFFEYYCPDGACGGPGWLQLPGFVTKISQVGELM